MDDGYENTYEYPFPMTCVNRNLPMEPANQTSVDVKTENKTPVWKMVVASILFLCISVALSVAAVMLVFRFQKTNGEELPSMNANMESMTSKSVNLSAEISDLKAMIGRQKTEISITQHTLQKLSASSAVQKLELSTLKAELKSQKTEMQDFKTLLNQTTNNLTSLEEMYSTNRGSVTTLESNLTSLEIVTSQTETSLNSARNAITINQTDISSLTTIVNGIVKIRLVGSGSTLKSGRVEVFMNELWGTVCDDSWDIDDGHVVCRQIGYSRASSVTTRARPFGAGTGNIWMDEVACNGNERRVTDCSYAASHDCSHREDAGVYCV